MIYKMTWFYVHYLMRVSFLELGNGIKIPQDRSFGQYNRFQVCSRSKIQGKTITGFNVKYMEHSCHCHTGRKRNKIPFWSKIVIPGNRKGTLVSGFRVGS